MGNLKIISIRMEQKTHHELRKLSYLTEQPIAELVRQGIEIIIEKNKKILTNSDVAV